MLFLQHVAAFAAIELIMAKKGNRNHDHGGVSD
jgi:hypothetical protein